ncbi:MAG TPA: 4Fe-4S binding protein [Firmicutes bacterium]|jgi:predicted aldo/keto reductase-like oxidoreductase|nr:4Fe-4S binding protein [Bacillota bacterium]
MVERRKLGRSGLVVSRLCLGTLTIGPLQANLTLAEGARVIRTALEEGIDFIETADSYRTYDYIRRALVGWTQPVVIASRSYDYTYDGMRDRVEKALQELNRDYIDLFMLHEQESRLTLQGHAPALEYLAAAKETGKVRAIGVSTHVVEVVQACAEHPIIDVVQPIVNVAGLGIKGGTLQDMLAAMSALRQAQRGVYAMKPLGGGNLLKRFSQAWEFVLNLDCLDAIAVGMKTPAEVKANVRIIKGEQKPEDISVAMAVKEKHLHISDWCQGCGRCAQRCRQRALYLRDGKMHVDHDRCLLCGYCAAVCPEFCIKVV